MALSALLSDDVTAATSIAFTPVAGVASAATTVHVWLDKGTAGGEAHDVKGWPEVQVAGVWVTTGHPALDEGWFQAALVGGTGPVAESRFVAGTGNAYRTVKASKPFDIGDLYGNCARYVSVRATAPLDAAAGSFNWRFRITSDVVSVSTDPNLPCGVVRGLGDTSRWEWIVAPVITATGTPDANVHGAFHSTNWFGVFRQRCVADSIALNQNDSSSSALTTGQAYKALIYRTSDHSTALSVVKGTRAASASAVIPALPAGGLPVAVVHVAYSATTSVITNGNITNIATSGWATVTAGTGLNAILSAFALQVPGSFIRLTQSQTIALTASSTNRIWVNSDATTSVVTADGNPPYLGSEQVASVTTDGSGVTAIDQSMLRFEDSAGQWVEMQAAAGNESVTASVARAVVPFRHQLVSVRATVRAKSSGATGSTICDVNRSQAGTVATVFTSQAGSPETRPAIAAQAFTATGLPEVTADGLPGDCYVVDCDVITSGGSRAADLSVSLLVYPRP